MIAENTRYRDWKAYRCLHGQTELTVITEIGPRILSLRRKNSANMLYEDTTNFCLGKWRLYGGHRFTVAPEGSESYLADNADCSVEWNCRVLRITAPTGENGTRRVLAISGAPEGEGFDLQHILENRGTQAWRGALWAITCVPAGIALAPLGASTIRCWPNTAPSVWERARDHVVVRSTEGRGKIGVYSNPALLASLQSEATLVIHDPAPPLAADCADGQCNLEIFSSPSYLELETLGAIGTLLPGESAVHRQHWRLLEPGFGPRDWAKIAELSGCGSPGLVAHA